MLFGMGRQLEFQGAYITQQDGDDTQIVAVTINQNQITALWP